MNPDLQLFQDQMATLGFALNDRDLELAYLLVFYHPAGVRMWYQRGGGRLLDKELSDLVLPLSSIVDVYHYKNTEELMPVFDIIRKYGGRSSIVLDRKSLADMNSNQALHEIHIYSKLRDLVP